MRNYETDSSHAMARILSVALLSDGGIDKSEIDWIAQTKVMDRLGIQPAIFDEVIHDFYEDMMTSTNYFDAVQVRLASDTIDALLDEIADPHRQSIMLSIMLDVTCADGSMSDGERELLARATERWGSGRSWPIRISSPYAPPVAGRT